MWQQTNNSVSSHSYPVGESPAPHPLFQHNQTSAPRSESRNSFSMSTMMMNNNNNNNQQTSTVKPSSGFAKSLSTLVGRLATSSVMTSNQSQSNDFSSHQQQRSTSNSNINKNDDSLLNNNNNNIFVSPSSSRHHPPVVLNGNTHQGNNNNENGTWQQQQNSDNNNNNYHNNINNDGAPQQVLIESLQNLITFTCVNCGAKRQRGSHCSHCDSVLPMMRRCDSCKAIARGNFCSQCGAQCSVVVKQHDEEDDEPGRSVSLNTSQNHSHHQGRSTSGISDSWRQVESAWKSRTGFGN